MSDDTKLTPAQAIEEMRLIQPGTMDEVEFRDFGDAVMRILSRVEEPTPSGVKKRAHEEIMTDKLRDALAERLWHLEKAWHAENRPEPWHEFVASCLLADVPGEEELASRIHYEYWGLDQEVPSETQWKRCQRVARFLRARILGWKE